MPGLPEVVMTGALTDAPELRFTKDGVAVATFTVACNDRTYDKAAATWIDGDATFLRCTLWRQPAENAAESLLKGNRVVVVGRLKQRSFETREGEKRTVLELDVTEIGASLKWATVKVTRMDRESVSSQTGLRREPADDPWGSEPEASGGFTETPPF